MRRIRNEKQSHPRKSRNKFSEIAELRRICCEETDRARQLRIDEFSLQQERNPTTLSQLLTQKSGFTEQGEFLGRRERLTIQRQRAALEHPHVASQPLNIPSPKGVLSRDSGLPLDTRNTMGTSGNVFESLPARDGPSSGLFENFTEVRIIILQIGTRYCRCTSEKKVSVEEQRAQKCDGFLRGRQIAYMIYEHFRATRAYEAVQDQIYSMYACRKMTFRISIQDGTKLHPQQVKYLRKRSGRVYTSKHHRILFSFRRYWLCMNKKMGKVRTEEGPVHVGVRWVCVAF